MALNMEKGFLQKEQLRPGAFLEIASDPVNVQNSHAIRFKKKSERRTDVL
jgi:hypothetical protein